MTETQLFPKRTWQVLLIGGASGVGKSNVSYRIARHFGVGITEVDDFQVLLEHLTTPEQQPAIHFWNTHPEAPTLPAEKLVEQGIAIGRAMQTALEIVIGNHLDSLAPIVLEGDFILPSLAAQPVFGGFPNQGLVKSIFLLEDDEAQLRQNYLLREPARGEQTKRARVSFLYGQWLAQQARQFNLPTIPARPWESVFYRLLCAIE